MLLKNKKGADLIIGNLTFIILNIIFFAAMILFISSIGTSDNSLEKEEVRRIALALNELRPNSELTIHLDRIYAAAEKNGFKEPVVVPNYEEGIITVRVRAGEGNSFRLFNKLDYASLSLDSSKKIMVVKT